MTSSLELTIRIGFRRGFYSPNGKGWIPLESTVDFLLSWLAKVAIQVYSIKEVEDPERGKVFEVVFKPKELSTESFGDLEKNLHSSLLQEESVEYCQVKIIGIEFTSKDWRTQLAKTLMEKVSNEKKT